MIPDIKELNFPTIDGKQYATLTHAEVNISHMGEPTITTQVKIDGAITPDFSQDWEVGFQGHKYIMPLRMPQGSKENTPLNSVIDLTFQHWAVYQLKRWYFFTVQPVDTGTAIADKYVADVILNLGDFCILLGQVLNKYYGNTITIDLNPEWQYKLDAIPVSINHSDIWKVITETFYDKYGVTWRIEPTEDNSNTVKDGERYVIKVGYPNPELDHVFKYGFEGGLLKVERQVQSDEIRNMIIGRGGENNLPKYYFKKSPDEEMWFTDPDWVVELENIYFDRLHNSVFRSYVQGWKAAHLTATDSEGNLLYGGYFPIGETNAKVPWAYRKGFTDEKFDPIEYVADEITTSPQLGNKQITISPGFTPWIEKDSSIYKYGPLLGFVDDNDEIYPTIQGSGMDIAVDVEQIESDNDEVVTEDESEVVLDILSGLTQTVEIPGKQRITAILQSEVFTIPEGMYANVDEGEKVFKLYKTETKYKFGRIGKVFGFKPISVTINVDEYNLDVEEAYIRVINADTGDERSAAGIPAGRYYCKIVLKLHNATDSKFFVDISCPAPKLLKGSLTEKINNTFSVWVRNIWNSTKKITESETTYANRVWTPVLGDREGGEAAVVFTTGALALSEDYEFKIVGMPVYDTSKTYVEKDSNGNVTNTYTSYWRLTLAKSDAELESSGMWVPSTKRQGKAGDKFVFINSEMTHEYTLWGESNLTDWLYDVLDEKSEIKPTWIVQTDRVRLNNEGKPDALIHQLKAGSSLILEDERFIGGSQQETLYLQSIKYTYREPTKDDAALNPDVEILLSDKYVTSINPVATMEGEITALQRQVGSLSNIAQVVRAVGDKKYLRKDRPDRTPYDLNIGGKATIVKGASFGNFIQGLLGAQIDENGNAEVESLTSRSYLKVFELIYNRIATQEGDTSFSDSSTIDYIYETTNAGITAQLRKRWDGDFTSFQPGDVVYGYVNNLDKASAKEYGKAWARIVSVDRSSNVITLAPYMNAEVPGGVNLSLTESMIITRYGNAIEPSETTAANPNYAPFIKKKNGKWVNTRQSTFFISTDSGNLVELMGVNKPIITKENMGLVLGKIPEGLLPANIEESLNPEQPYLYARGILVQDLIRIGYEGLQPRTSNYRGQWSAETAASSTEYYRNTTDMFDTVSHNGAMWQNVTIGTTDEPADTSSGWLRMTGTDDQTRGLWQIVPNASQIWIGEDETIYPYVLSVTVLRSSLKGDFEYTDNASLIVAGAKLQYSIDNSSEWHDFSMGTSEHLEVESGLGLTGEAAWFETEASEPFMTEGNNFTNLSDVTNNIRFRLVDIWANPNGGGEFTRVTVPVIRDGSSVAIASTSVKYTGTATSSKPDDSAFTYDWGTPFFAALVNNGWIYTWSRTEIIYTDGKSTVTYARTKNGDKGEKGAMVYPAGVFTSGNTYDGADGACPVVEYEGIYYLLKPGFVYNSTALDDSAYPNPAVAAAANYKWEQFTMFKSVFTEVLMANFANIGSMIFYGDTIFSQNGRLGFIDLDTYDYNTQSYAKRYIDVTGLDGNGKAWYLRLNNEMTETGTLQQIIDNGNYLTNSTLGKFIPNVCINFKTGEVQTNNGLEIGQTNNPDEAAVAIVGHGNIISDGVIGGGVKVYEVATTDWNSPAASTISLINRTAGSTFGINLPTLRASLAAMGRKKKSGSGDTAVYDATEPFAYVITYVNTYTSVGSLLITGSGNPGNTMVGEIISTQSRLPALVGSTRNSTTNKPTSTTMKLLPGQTVQILLEYTGTPQSQSYKGTYTAYIL